MVAPIGLRDDFDAPALRALAKASRDPDQLCRLLSLAEIYDGGLRGDAARLGGVGLQTVREWALRFNERGPEGPIDPKGSGRPRHYAQHRDAMAVFKKNFPAKLAEIAVREAGGKDIELWFQDEARIGQKNKITRRWAKRGTRPAAPHDQRTRSAYIFGAICPKEGKGAGLVPPRCNTEAMTLHLREISRAVKPGAHAIVVLDRAGWHGSKGLEVPDNITLLPLPPRSPELNPVENVWQFIRDNWLSNRVFKSYDDILDHCGHAWNSLTEQPWKIMSVGTRQWAHE